MGILDDQQQLGRMIRSLDRRVCVPNDPECTLFFERGREGITQSESPPTGGGEGVLPAPPPPIVSCATEVGTLTSPSTTGVQTINHSLGVAPKVLIIFGTQQTADGITTDALFSMGFGTSSIPTGRA